MLRTEELPHLDVEVWEFLFCGDGDSAGGDVLLEESSDFVMSFRLG
jgi:hypothetical protein